MTDTSTRPQPGALTGAGLRRVLAVLCLTEITSWGILYYAFPVLSVSISADTGWSPTAITAAFSLGQLATALAGIPVGRILDRVGPRTIMTAGSVLAVPALVLIALAPTLPVFYAGWLLAGTAMGAVLYPPAFAALTRWYGDRSVHALMILTLAAGLASTIFAPLTSAVDQQSDWRTTYVILAAILAAITIPGHWWGLRGSWPTATPPANGADLGHREIARSPAFLALVATLALGAFTAFAGVFNLVPLLLEQGFSPSVAAVTLGLGGAGQVLGRLGYLTLVARTSVRSRIVVILAGTAATTALLGAVTTAAALIGAAIGAGLVRGLFTLIQATAITDRWGSTHYGRLGGLMSAPIVVVMALAPWAGTALASATGSYATAYLVLAVVAVIAALLAVASVPRLTAPPSTEGTS
ncbi:Predicted arabinose efflux permease, MFS family [Rhodococcus rhodochrous J3]|uniref:Predicted arabinose efflux permease, MFS family n=1 Tax=Rhodococcus rhodochrous J3 TaxID=903528 RepID=A0ABY1MIG2_RHORH|nr:MFS transporter [Rhodococcus rhodochrous]MBF4478994.1 MFS transporter [Rhodococcus rhodochrous]SMG58263.1 Predicted arabinose efflux permease, MFS family [Rhodococcus rhodochrous J3]